MLNFSGASLFAGRFHLFRSIALYLALSSTTSIKVIYNLNITSSCTRFAHFLNCEIGSIANRAIFFSPESSWFPFLRDLIKIDAFFMGTREKNDLKVYKSGDF